MNAVIKEFTPEEQLDRRNWIGGSDAAAAIGLNKYQSQFDLWQVKLGLAPEFLGNETTKWGRLHEPAVRQEVAERTGKVIRLPTETIRHPVWKFAACHPDGVMDDNYLYEGKTARYPDGFGEEGTDIVPQHYLVQVQHNMGVLGLPAARLGVLIGGSELRIYVIEADSEMQGLIFEGEERFWHHVMNREPPPPDLARMDALSVLRRMYPGTNGEIIKADARAVELRASFDAQSLLEKTAEANKNAAKAGLLALMGEATFLEFPDGKSLRRAIVKRKAYEVRATEFLDARYLNS